MLAYEKLLKYTREEQLTNNRLTSRKKQIKILCILNPKSGISKHKSIPKLLKKTFRTQDYFLHIEHTKYAGHAYEIAQSARDIYNCIIAVGGDGTVHEIGQALIYSKTALGIIPVGSGNGFARSLHIPLSPHAAINHIKNMLVKEIDTVSCNGEHVINIAGFGFEAEVSNVFANTKIRGGYSYVPFIIKKLFKQKTFAQFTCVYNNITETHTVFLASIANANQWGLNAYIAPKAHLDDGFFEFVIVKPFPLHKSLSMTYKLFNKTIQTSAYCSTIRLKDVTIIPHNTSILYHIDGEPREATCSLHFKAHHKALKVIV